MGYRIQYSEDKEAEKENGKRNSRIWMTVLCLSIFFLGVHFLWPQGEKVLRDLLLPEDPESIRRGWECFLSQLRNGGTAREALLVFCREILMGAEIA